MKFEIIPALKFGKKKKKKKKYQVLVEGNDDLNVVCMGFGHSVAIVHTLGCQFV
jgi:hypothetical protein